ncbi:MAG: PAS domain-containing protein [Nitrospirota bacterium]
MNENIVVALDIISAIAFVMAMALALLIPRKVMNKPSKMLLCLSLSVYIFVGISNALEHGGITAYLASYEDEAEILFPAFFLFFMYSLAIKEEMDRRIQPEEEEKLARKNWEDIFQAIGHSVFITDLHHNIISVNDATLKATGARDKGEIKGKKCYQVLNNLNEPPENCPCEILLTTGIAKTVEMEMKAFGGIYLVSCTPILGQEGNIEKFIHIATDISERKKAEEELKKAEEEKAIILETMSELVVYVDTNMKILWTNRAAADSLGLAADVLVGSYCYKEWFHRSDPCPHCPAKKILETGQPQEGETYSPDGRVWHFRGYPVRDEKGEITAIVEVVEDITERKRSEDDLRNQRNLFETILAATPDLLVLKDRDSVYQAVNPSFCQFLGRKAEEIIGKTDFDLFPYNEAEMYSRDDAKVMESGKPQIQDEEVTSADGKNWLQVAKTPIYDNAGAVMGILCSARDITERKKAEEAQYQYTKNLGILNKVIMDISSTLDLDEVLERLTKNAVELLDADGGTVAIYDEEKKVMTYPYHYNMPENLIGVIAEKGRGLAEYTMLKKSPVLIEDYPGHPRALKEFIDAGVKVLAAVPLIARDKAFGALGIFGFTPEKKFTGQQLELLEGIGREAAIAIENARLFEEIKQFSMTLEQKVAKRTSELQDAQNAMINLVEDIQLKAEDLEKANIRLKELDRLKSMFIASMSHELRTPLNSIIGFSSVLLNEWLGPVNADQKEDLATILKAGKHLLNLINDVIDVSKIEAGVLAINIDEFDLYDVITEAVNIVSKEIKDKGLELKVESIHQNMHTDKQRLSQCILNLLSNAVKFTEKGSVSVQARLIYDAGYKMHEGQIPPLRPPLVKGGEGGLRNFVEISVEDTGRGINEEDIPKLFQPFVRLDIPHGSNISGAGLGLYLTKKLVTEVLKGDIIVESRYGEGSRFTLRIPVKL